MGVACIFGCWVGFLVCHVHGLRVFSTTPNNLSADDGATWVTLWDGRHAQLDVPFSQGALQLSEKAKAKEKHWAVCIVGQLSRLEVQTKVQNAISMLESNGSVGVDVYVVLETDGNHFSNPETHYGGPICENAHTQGSVRKTFAKWYTGGLFVQHSSSSKFSTTNFPSWRQPWALEIQMQQFTHTASCYHLMEKAGQIGKYTDFLKLRDGTIAALPIQHIGDSKNIWVKNTQSWGGLNDKHLYAPGGLIKAVLTRPIELARQANAGEPSAVQRLRTLINPEELLKEALRGLPILEVSPESLPLVDGRCVDTEGVATYCLVPPSKDAYPRGKLSARPCSVFFAE